MSHSLISYTPKQNIKTIFKSPPLIAALLTSFAFPKYFNVLECCCYSVTKCCLTLCNPMDCSMPGFPVHHQLPELAQTCVHRVGDTLNHLILFPLRGRKVWLLEVWLEQLGEWSSLPEMQGFWERSNLSVAGGDGHEQYGFKHS